MTYDLAKRLKDAGFPQKGKGIFSQCIDGSCGWRAGEDWHIACDFGRCGEGEVVYMPTLSELIEACGDYFQNLRHLKSWSRTVESGGWRARGFTFASPHHHKTINGKTPIEAVANLWLALNEKKI